MMKNFAIFFALVLFLATLEADVAAATGRAAKDDSAVGFVDSQEQVKGRYHFHRNDTKPWPDSRPSGVPPKESNKRSVEKERDLILSGQACAYQLDRKADVGAKDDKYSTENKGDDQRHRRYINCTKPWPDSRPRLVHPKDYNKRNPEADGKERLTGEKERAVILSGQASTHQLDLEADVGAKDDKYLTANKDEQRHRIYRNDRNPSPVSHPRAGPQEDYNKSTLETDGKQSTVEKERELISSGLASTHQLDRKADVGAKDDKYPTANDGARHRLFRNRSNPWPASRPHTVPTEVYNQRKP